ncbi:MAG: hypothetical protein V2B14_03975 [bacterium]
MKKFFILILVLSFIFNINLGFNKSFSKENPLNSFFIHKKNVQEPKKEIITDISLSDFVRSYHYIYLDTFVSTLAVLASLDIAVISYDSSKGEIKARLNNGKDIFILVISYDEKITYIRITPINGDYNIPVEIVKNILDNVKLELTKK